jgi:hypothetical protein
LPAYVQIMRPPPPPPPPPPLSRYRPKHRCWLHWLIINIPSVDVARGEEAVEYQTPEPPHGRHRYLYLLCRQAGKVTLKPPKKRAGFQVGVLNLRNYYTRL